MKILVFKNDDGTNNVVVKRTMSKENPSRAVMRVKADDLQSVMAQLVGEMRRRGDSSTPS